MLRTRIFTDGRTGEDLTPKFAADGTPRPPATASAVKPPPRPATTCLVNGHELDLMANGNRLALEMLAYKKCLHAIAAKFGLDPDVLAADRVGLTASRSKDGWVLRYKNTNFVETIAGLDPSVAPALRAVAALHARPGLNATAAGSPPTKLSATAAGAPPPPAPSPAEVKAGKRAETRRLAAEVGRDLAVKRRPSFLKQGE